MSIHIYQSDKTGSISKLIVSSEPPQGEYLIDCDTDSFLLKGDYPETSYEVVKDSNLFTEIDLLPVIAIDKNNIVLMQAFTNRVGLDESLRTGYAHYFSRSRGKLWKKGEESGHLQTILSVTYNNIYKFLIYSVVQKSAACHTNYYSCFYRKYINGYERIIYKEKFNPEVEE